MSGAASPSLICPMCGAGYQPGTAECAACGEDLRGNVRADAQTTWRDILMTLAVIMGVHAVMVVLIAALMGTVW